MNKFIIFLTAMLLIACKQSSNEQLSAQQIIDKSIAVCGGEHYDNSIISFDFRDHHYISEYSKNRKVLKRILKNDSLQIKDIRMNSAFKRYVNDSLVKLSDSIASLYSNSVNSVHYFSKLPFHLNDAAVQKEYLGEIRFHDHDYHKIKVSFDQEGGGDDFDDIYIFWINKATLKPDYLGYSFHVDGGGTRFRKAFNERYVGGIRFVDYENYKPKDASANIFMADSLFLQDELVLLSKIVLEDVSVSQDNYN